MDVNDALAIDEDAPRFYNSDRAPSGSSILEEGSIEEFGRTYHSYNPGAYLLPNDGEEQDRLDLQHKVVQLLLDGNLSLAPICGKPKYVLDIATGTGIWAIEFAREHPDCFVIGTDLSQIQPPESAPNCCFVREDAERDDWVFAKQFDYIHLRLTFTCFDSLETVLGKIYTNLAPGGWVEFQDHTPEVFSSDGSADGSAMQKYGQALMQGLQEHGRDATRIKNLVSLLGETGFIDIEQKLYQYPVGDWPQDPKFKKVGQWAALNIDRALGSTVKMLVAGGLSEHEVCYLSDQVRREIAENRVHGYMQFYVVYGRKPPL